MATMQKKWQRREACVECSQPFEPVSVRQRLQQMKDCSGRDPGMDVYALTCGHWVCRSHAGLITRCALCKRDARDFLRWQACRTIGFGAATLSSSSESDWVNLSDGNSDGESDGDSYMHMEHEDISAICLAPNKGLNVVEDTEVGTCGVVDAPPHKEIASEDLTMQKERITQEMTSSSFKTGASRQGKAVNDLQTENTRRHFRPKSSYKTAALRNNTMNLANAQAMGRSSVLMELSVMGFDSRQISRIPESCNDSVESALDWLLAHAQNAAWKNREQVVCDRTVLSASADEQRGASNSVSDSDSESSASESDSESESDSSSESDSDSESESGSDSDSCSESESESESDSNLDLAAPSELTLASFLVHAARRFKKEFLCSELAHTSREGAPLSSNRGEKLTFDDPKLRSLKASLGELATALDREVEEISNQYKTNAPLWFAGIDADESANDAAKAFSQGEKMLNTRASALVSITSQCAELLDAAKSVATTLQYQLMKDKCEINSQLRKASRSKTPKNAMLHDEPTSYMPCCLGYRFCDLRDCFERDGCSTCCRCTQDSLRETDATHANGSTLCCESCQSLNESYECLRNSSAKKILQPDVRLYEKASTKTKLSGTEASFSKLPKLATQKAQKRATQKTQKPAFVPKKNTRATRRPAAKVPLPVSKARGNTQSQPKPKDRAPTRSARVLSIGSLSTPPPWCGCETKSICTLTSLECCCACSDKRKGPGWAYKDGLGMVQVSAYEDCAGYCPACADYWRMQIKGSQTSG